ncbi:MAG: hypothetical protein HY923_06395 [Elusimicrobia bacterium]|nr:hypothetical protein [Elusimicrobiota bacterium]
MKFTRRPLALILSVLTALASTPHQAAAQVIVGGGAAAGQSGVAGGVPRIELGAMPVLTPAPAFAPGLTGVMPSIAPSIAVPGAVALPAAAIPALPVSALAALPTIPGAALAVPAAQAAKTPVAQLALAGERIAAAAAKGDDQSGILETLFTGAKSVAASLGDAVPGSESVPSALTPVNSAASVSEGRATPPTPITLESLAIDSSKPLPARQAAVAQITDKASLGRVADSNPQGGAADYEIHRAALIALAEQGEVKSLRAVSPAHKDEILADLVQNKPAALVSDYDDTLEKFREPISAPVAAGLTASIAQGVKTAILTDRPDTKKSDKDVTILDSIASMTPEQKAKLVVGSNSGARLTTFDAKGEPVVAYDANLKFSDAQAAAITAASAKTADKFGRYNYNGAEENLAAFKWVRFLPLGMSAETVAEAEKFMQAELDAAGTGLKVSGRQAADPKNPSYLSLSMLDKTVGIKALQETQGFVGKMLVLGDSFFGTRTVDSDMSKAAPSGSLSLAVGGLADPRIPNIFVWPTKGAEATAEILGAVGKPAAPVEEMNKKAIGGLFAQRTISIIAFILTSIAYPLITIPAVGVAGYGALMALGPLAAIATGPLNGLIADRMSARNGLILMAVMRVVLALALPAFALFGVLNFWTLLLAAIANGWALSSLMITEGTYIRRLAGAKNVPMVNGLAAINYLSLQVILGLIIGVGKYVDHFNLMIPFYISAAVHVAIVIPIIWKTIPNIKPAAASVAKAAVSFVESTRAKGAAAKAFIQKYWKEAALFGAAVGAYFVWSSALPMSAALMYWITRSEGFKAIWSQKPLRWSMLLSALAAGLVYPMQYLALPLMALTLGGVAGKGLILGQLLGAYFFGQLVANAGQLSAPTNATKMPDLRVPFTKLTVPFERVVQAGVLTLAAVWAGVSLFPGSLLAAAAAVGVGLALLYGSSKLSARGWVKFLGVGLAAVLLPFAFWGSMPALFASVLLVGMFAGPSAVVLSSYFQTNAKNSNLGAAIGVNGSTFNAAISFGYGLMSLIVSLFTPAFPGALAPIGLIFLAAGVLFFLAPKLLPGLPESSVNKTAKK